MDGNIHKPGTVANASPEILERILCPICGPCPASLIGTSNRLPVSRCEGCDLIYVSECPPLNSTHAYFRETHKKDSESTRIAYVDYRKKSLQREANRIRSLMPQGGRLLDVGTASGYFLRQFRRHANWQVEGVEPSRVSAEFARQTFGLNVHEGFLSDQKFDEAAFDIVCSLDAFGCHRQPREDMLEFHRILTPGGFLAIEIPGLWFRMMTSSGLIYRKPADRTLRLQAGVNFFYYTRTTLTRLASIACLEFVESYPEGLPAAGNRITLAARKVYDVAAAALYRATGGHLNLCAKELCIFRKPVAKISAVLPVKSGSQSPDYRRAG